jgi:amino acid transporter
MPFWDKEKKEAAYDTGSPDFHDSDIVTTEDGEIAENTDQLHRRLGNRQIQLIAIGGSIGTALFVSIGSGLVHGGPGSLFIAYFIYACMLGLVNNCVRSDI